ncbi:MAG: MC/SLC25 family protein [Gammaproteobacteria bacterium]|nr:MC/SLC25 family protein [Gammaproteobacteria bacterium]
MLRNSKSETPVVEPKKSEIKKYQPSVFQSLAIGSAGGAGEVLINHPLWTLKTRKQEKLPSLLAVIKTEGASLTPISRMLYCGVLPNMASMVPTTAIQVGLDRCFQKAFLQDSNQVGITHKLGSAFVAGVGSALVSCPSELVLISQAKLNLGNGLNGFYKSGTSVVQQYGMRTLYTGLTATALRDGIFSMFLLGVVPYSVVWMKMQFGDNAVADLSGKTLAGVGATVVSHSADTIKAKQQAHANLKQKLGFIESAAQIYSKNGIQGFFAGGGWRGLRVISGLAIVSTVKEEAETYLAKRNLK